MSGTFPSSPEAASVKVTSFTPTLVSVAQSLKRQVRRRGGQRWAFEVSFPPMTRAEFAPIYAFCIAQKGQYETFSYIPPIISSSQGNNVSGTPLVNTAHAAGSAVIGIDGWDVSTLVLKAGDFIKFAHDKVYMVTADATANASGYASVSIEPPLVEDVANNSSVFYNSIPFTMALVSDIQEYDVGAPNIYGFSVAMVEVV